MDNNRNTRRQSVIGIPKPESDLAEWSSKIKAMQQQVDADDEAEQKRLEEEIAAARQARMRRSRGSRPPNDSEIGMSLLSSQTNNDAERPTKRKHPFRTTEPEQPGR